MHRDKLMGTKRACRTGRWGQDEGKRQGDGNGKRFLRERIGSCRKGSVLCESVFMCNIKCVSVNYSHFMFILTFVSY